MRKLLTLILVLCSIVGFAQMRGGALYDPGAARSNLSNVDATATPSMTSITLSDKVKAAWADILGDIYASGTVKVATGTAAAPAYSFGSDPDTGIYSAGAGTVDFVINGQGRVQINSNGLGVNGAPDSPLYVAGPNGSDFKFKNLDGTVLGSEYIKLSLNNSNGVGANFESAAFRAISTNGGANLGVLAIDTSGVEAMRITSGGNVLIAASTDDGANKLQVNGGVSVKAPYVLARNNTTFAIANDTSTTATFTAEVFDDKNNFAPSTGVFTAPQSGLYELWAKITWDNISAVGPRIARFEKNGDQTFMPSQTYASFSAGSGYPQICLAGTIYLSANDTVVLKNYQASGGDLNIIGAANEMVLSITYLRDR
jgi:hypothetical protein